MKKALIVATVVRFLGFERNDIKILKELGYEVHCATDLTGENERTSDIDMVRHQIDFSRSPFSKRTLIAYKQLKKLLQEEHFDLIHCHTPVGGILARLAAKKYRKKGELKVIYTAHGFHFFKGAPIVNWLLYYPAEWICSWMTDVLITITKEDYDRAKKKMHAKKTEYIPGIGIDVDKFSKVNIEESAYKNNLGLKKDDVMLLSIGELNDNKNHSIIIKTLPDLANNTHYFIAGKGDKERELKVLANSLGVDKRVHLLGFRNDIDKLLKCADIYVLPSKREGLNVSLMEAMASGCPCICKAIRGNTDLIEDSVGGYLVKDDNKTLWREKIQKLTNDKKNMMDMGANNRKKINNFSHYKVTDRMKKIYSRGV